MIRARGLWALLVGSVATLVACEADRVAPVVLEPSGEGGGTTSSVVASSSSSSSTGAGTPVREVFLRNPFGDQEGNLLVDGGFELSIVSNSGQHGWVSGGEGDLLGETGGLCRGGLRCARAPRGALLFARGTSAPGAETLTAEIWVKPDGATSCAGIDLYVISCDSFEIRRQHSEPSEPDADGWCAIGGTAPGSVTATCLYLENAGDGDFLIDDGSLRVDAGTPRSTRPEQASLTVSATTRANLHALRDRLRRTLPLGSNPRAGSGRPGPGRAADHD